MINTGIMIPLITICSIGILTSLGTLIGANVIGVGAFTSVNMLIALAISFYLAFNRV